MFGREPPTTTSVYRWYKLFDHISYICEGKRSGKRQGTEAHLGFVRAGFLRRPRKTSRRAVRQLNVQHTTVQNILRKLLKLKSYISTNSYEM